jgi:hypothetical protein
MIAASTSMTFASELPKDDVYMPAKPGSVSVPPDHIKEIPKNGRSWMLCLKHHEQVRAALGLHKIAATPGVFYACDPRTGSRTAQVDLLFDPAVSGASYFAWDLEDISSGMTLQAVEIFQPQGTVVSVK